MPFFGLFWILDFFCFSICSLILFVHHPFCCQVYLLVLLNVQSLCLSFLETLWSFFTSAMSPFIVFDSLQISSLSFISFFLILFFIYFWLRWVFVAECGPSLVAASGGSFLLRCAGFSLWWLLLLQSMGSRCAGFSSCGVWASVVVARGL